MPELIHLNVSPFKVCLSWMGSKLWIIISPSLALKFIDIMKKVIKVDCPYLLDFKVFFLYPALLHSWGIKFKLVVQKAS